MLIFREEEVGRERDSGLLLLLGSSCSSHMHGRGRDQGKSLLLWKAQLQTHPKTKPSTADQGIINHVTHA